MSNDTAPLDSPYLTADEAAVYLRFTSTHSFRASVRRYGIPCLRRGRRIFFTKTQLDEFMAVATEATTAQRRRRRKAH